MKQSKKHAKKRSKPLNFKQLATLTLETVTEMQANPKNYSPETQLSLLRGMLLNFGGFKLEDQDCHCPHCDYHRAEGSAEANP